MRDFRDAKAMAHTIRTSLAASDLKITVSQSLELIAKAFGVADWNTLAAAINADSDPPRQSSSAASGPTADGTSETDSIGFSPELAATLHRAIASAKGRSHEYATLEHLLLALVDDGDAFAVIKACNADLAMLRIELSSYIDNELIELKKHASNDAKPSAGFQRTIQRAVIHVRASGRQSLTGADVLVALFSEQEGVAANLLNRTMKRIDAVNFVEHGESKRGGNAAA